MMHKACRNIEEVPYCLSRSSIEFQGHRGQKIADFDQNWVFPDCNSSFNSQMDLKWCTQSLVKYKRVALLYFEVIRQISRSHRLKKRQFESNLSKITRPVAAAAIKSLRFALFRFRMSFGLFSLDIIYMYRGRESTLNAILVGKLETSNFFFALLSVK